MGKGKELELEPADVVEFKGTFKDPVAKEVKVKNGTGKRMAFKIKCSDNDMFKIRPVMGILKDGESANVTLTFTARDKGKAPKEPHHFSLYEFEAKDDAKAARKVWEGPEAKKKLRHTKAKVVFKDTDDKKEDKKEEKKEEKEDKKEDKKEEKEEEKKEDKEEEKKDEPPKDDAPKEEEKKEDEPAPEG
jgi:hypothetical protein